MSEQIPTSLTPRPFRPAWWLPGAHAQTIAAKYLRSTRGVALRRERISTPDGDFLDLDWAEVERERPTPPAAGPAPLVVVLHGLEGCARSAYALHAYRSLAARGIRAVGLNFRSCGGEVNHTRRFYHAGETADLAFALALLAERVPGAALGAIGFSLGGNVLLKYLGESGGAVRLEAAVAVSVPFDLAASARRLERGMGRLYSRIFLRSLLRKFRYKTDVIGDACEPGRVLASRTLREFDDAATAPLHGFRGVDHYYTAASSAAFLAAIRTPTLLLHAADDPFLPSNAIPHATIAANAFLLAGITERGGHVGFVYGSRPWAPRFWAEEEAARFLSRLLCIRTSCPSKKRQRR